jgi:hypothetical protein
VVDTREQTAAVMATLAGGDQRTEIDYAPWNALQELLTTGEQRVVVPFAPALADKIPPVAVRLRRDFATLLSLIRAHALLHRGTRPKDATGRIVATVADYTAVRELVADIYAEGIEATVSKTMRETVTTVAQAIGAGASSVSLAALAARLSLDKNSVHHRVKKATARGFLANLEDKRGKPAQIVLGDPLPADDGVLPTVGSLPLECWSENGGVAEGKVYAPTAPDENGQISTKISDAEARTDEKATILETDPPRDRGTYTPHPVRGRFSLQHSNTPKHSLQHPAEAQARAPAREQAREPEPLRDVRRHGRDGHAQRGGSLPWLPEARVHEVGARPVADAT